MKTSITLKALAFSVLMMTMVGCGAQKFKGSASDTTGTNGATNGTGKVMGL